MRDVTSQNHLPLATNYAREKHNHRYCNSHHCVPRPGILSHSFVAEYVLTWKKLVARSNIKEGTIDGIVEIC